MTDVVQPTATDVVQPSSDKTEDKAGNLSENTPLNNEPLSEKTPLNNEPLSEKTPLTNEPPRIEIPAPQESDSKRAEEPKKDADEIMNEDDYDMEIDDDTDTPKPKVPIQPDVRMQEKGEEATQQPAQQPAQQQPLKSSEDDYDLEIFDDSDTTKCKAPNVRMAKNYMHVEEEETAELDSYILRAKEALAASRTYELEIDLDQDEI